MDDDNGRCIVSLNNELSAAQSEVKKSELLRQAGLSKLENLRAEQALLQRQLAQVKARRVLAAKVAELQEQVQQKNKHLNLKRQNITRETIDDILPLPDPFEWPDLEDKPSEETFAVLAFAAEPAPLVEKRATNEAICTKHRLRKSDCV